MDTTALRAAYASYLSTARTVAAAESLVAPASGEWDAAQQLAHLAAVDAGILAVTCTIAAGGRAGYDNRSALEPSNLAAIAAHAGGRMRLCDRIEAQGDALCTLADQLGPNESAQPIPTLLVSGETVQIDQAIALGDLIGGLATDHLPRHAQQLSALLPDRARPTTITNDEAVPAVRSLQK